MRNREIIMALFHFCRKVLYLFIYLIPFCVHGQEARSPITTDTLRVQGYLIIEGHHEIIRKGSDIPRKFLFIPFEKFKEESFSAVYLRERQPMFNDLFIPTSFMEEMKLAGLNVYLRKALLSTLELQWEQSVHKTFERYLKQNTMFFKLKGVNRELSIFYLDGIWGRLDVPVRYSGSNHIEGYNQARLKVDKDRPTHYEYYYLLQTKSFAPVMFIDDRAMVKVKR